MNVHAYCIMTSHVHLIISAKEGYNLSDIIRDIKSYTSTVFKKCIKENNQESRKECLSAGPSAFEAGKGRVDLVF